MRGGVSSVPIEVIKMLAAPTKGGSKSNSDSELTRITTLTVLPRKLKTIQ